MRSNNEEGRSLADNLVELGMPRKNQDVQEKCTQANTYSVGQSSHSHSGQPKKQLDIKLVDILNSDEKLFTLTGIHSLDLLDGILECVSDIEEKPSNKKLLLLKERIVLVMVKLKQNLSFSAISILCGVSRQTCRSYFRNLCPIMARVQQVFIPWPIQEQLRKNLPKSFDNYRHCRIVLDCAETLIGKCKCLKCRVLTYSQYKGNHTVKWAICVAPSGLIIKVSKGFGDRASDKFIVNSDGALDLCDFNDGVMVDKGFRIDMECLERHIKLIRPPFLRQKKQLSREEALETAEIARARVHVERVIQRLREYKFLRGPVPWPLAPYFDDCLIISAALTNLGKPVINIDKFM